MKRAIALICCFALLGTFCFAGPAVSAAQKAEEKAPVKAEAQPQPDPYDFDPYNPEPYYPDPYYPDYYPEEEEYVLPEPEFRTDATPAKKLDDPAGYKVGDIVEFGSYVQNDGVPTPLRWRVLDPGTGLLLCENIIDCVPYMTAADDQNVPASEKNENGLIHPLGKMYKYSTVRKWLTGDFYNAAFTAAEQGRIVPSELENGRFDAFEPVPADADAGTTDTVFLLSGKEASNPKYGFQGALEADPLRAGAGRGTRLAVQNGFVTVTDPTHEMYDWSSVWWLRSPSGLMDDICIVRGNGEIEAAMASELPDSTYVGVRPAVRIRLTGGDGPRKTGDTDGDGVLSASDARLALRGAVGLETYAAGSPEFIAADADHDNTLTAGDARLILRAAVGLETLS